MKRRFPARHNDKNTHDQKPCHEHNIRHKFTLLNQTASTIHLPIGKANLNNIDTLLNGYRNRFIGNILYRQLNTRQVIKSYIRNRFICFYRNTPLIANNTDFSIRRQRLTSRSRYAPLWIEPIGILLL